MWDCLKNEYFAANPANLDIRECSIIILQNLICGWLWDRVYEFVVITLWLLFWKSANAWYWDGLLTIQIRESMSSLLGYILGQNVGNLRSVDMITMPSTGHQTITRVLDSDNRLKDTKLSFFLTAVMVTVFTLTMSADFIAHDHLEIWLHRSQVESSFSQGSAAFCHWISLHENSSTWKKSLFLQREWCKGRGAWTPCCILQPSAAFWQIWWDISGLVCHLFRSWMSLWANFQSALGHLMLSCRP